MHLAYFLWHKPGDCYLCICEILSLANSHKIFPWLPMSAPAVLILLRYNCTLIFQMASKINLHKLSHGVCWFHLVGTAQPPNLAKNHQFPAQILCYSLDNPELVLSLRLLSVHQMLVGVLAILLKTFFFSWVFLNNVFSSSFFWPLIFFVFGIWSV